MAFPQDRDEKRIGFCSAPWTDCITYANGDLKACDRNITAFGDWQKNGLKNTWQSEAFKEFRSAIAEGRYPTEDCASCHNNGTQRTALSSLGGAYVLHYLVLKDFFRQDIADLANLYPLLSLKKRSAESDTVIEKFFNCLDRLQRENSETIRTNKDFHNAILKLRVTAECLQDYLAGDLTPRRVAPFRQSQLQAKCTARCEMCVGKYTGEIVDGPTMDTKYVNEAFACLEDITDFWCNGAEYLFYKDWKKIAMMLATEGGTKLRVSTNGILLTDPTIRFIIDNKLVRFLTMSLDAATKETMESTRINVNYAKNIEQTRFLLKYATDQKHFFEFTAAFVLMKRNLHELPDFVRLMASLRPKDCIPSVTVLCQPLENFNVDGYRRFVHREHHTLLGDRKLREIFEETYKAHLETGIQVSFYNQKISEFMKEGMSLPRFFAREMDEEIFFSRLPDGKQYFLDLLKEDLDSVEQRFHSLYEKCNCDRNVLLNTMVSEVLLSNPIVSAVCEMSSRANWLIRKDLVKWADAVISEHERSLSHLWIDKKRIYYCEYFFGKPVRGSYVCIPSLNCTAEIVECFGKFVLLDNGQAFPFQSKIFPIEFVQNEFGLPLPNTAAIVEPSSLRKAYLRGLGIFFWSIHAVKERLLGGRKSLVLWKLSVAYRAMLALFGLRVDLVTVARSQS